MQTLPTTDTKIYANVFPMPFSKEGVECEAWEGQSIQEIIDIDPKDLEHNQIIVLHEGNLILPEQWSHYRPKGGTHLSIGVLPKGDLGDLISLGAVIALAVFAGPAATSLGASLGLAAGGTGILLLEAAIIFGGTLLINSLFGPSDPGYDSVDSPRDPSVFGISGIQNTLPGRTQPILCLYGEHRVYPFFAAQPFTTHIGDTQYLHLLFDLGYGPIEISDPNLLKIGDRMFSEFQGLTWEFHEGFPGDKSEVSSIYTRQHFTTPLSITLKQSDGWIEVSTPPDIDEVTINFIANGLYEFDDEGNRRPRRVSLQCQYLAEGGSAADWSGSFNVSFNGESSEALFRSRTLNIGTRGQHKVRFRRVTADSTDAKIRDVVQVYSLTSTNPDPPVRARGRSLFALRIQATDQLSGTINSFNGVFRKKVQTYVGGEWTSSYTFTSNPAWIFADILRGESIFTPVLDANIDGEGLLSWANHCEIHGFRFDAIFDARQSVWKALQAVASCGRASPTIRDGYIYSVVVDIVRTTPVDLLTPRDLLDFKGVKTFEDPPHGLIARYRDRSDNLYESKEVTIYDGGYTARTATDLRSFEAFGTTELAHVHRRARYAMAQSKLRPEEFEVTMDVKQLAITRGDYVDLVHDIPLVGVGQGRVTRNVLSGGQWIGFDIDEDLDPSFRDRLNARFQTFEGGRILAEVQKTPTPRPRRSASTLVEEV